MKNYLKYLFIFLMIFIPSLSNGETVVIGDGVQPEGITGGQTIKGGRSSGDNLTLESTSNATKGNITLGTSATPVATFNEATPTITFRSSLTFSQEEPLGVKGTITTGLASIQDVDVVNGYAYVLSFDDLAPNFHIFDVSNPDLIIAKDTINTGFIHPFKIVVLGKYAYVVDGTADSLSIFNIEDPDNIIIKGTITTNLDSPGDITVHGIFAYITSFTNSTFAIFDISDPNNIIARGTTTTGLSLPRRAFILNKYAYVTSSSNNTLAIFDISDPDNIVAKGTTTTGLNSPAGIYVLGHYAYVTSVNSDTLHIFDVSNPTAIVAKDTITTNIGTSREVYVNDRYAYLPNESPNTIAIYDISDPDNIVAKNTISTGLDGPTSLDISGKYIYVASKTNDTLAIFEIENITTPALKVGTLEADIFSTISEVNLSGFTNINGSLNVKSSVKFDDILVVNEGITQTSGELQHSVTSGITASTTQTQGQQPLTTTVNEVSTVANALDTVTLPTAAIGKIVTIINNGANTLQVFPASGDNLGAGVDTAISLTSGAIEHFVTYDTTNWESLLSSTSAFLGEITIHANATATTINSTAKVHAVRLFSTGDVANFTFDAGSTGVITNTANNGSGFLRITDATHGLASGVFVTVTGLATAAQNDICSVTVIDVNTFDCTNITFVTASETGFWDEGSSLTLSGATSGLYQISVGISATSASANQTFIWHPYINGNAVHDVHIERKFAATDIGRMAGSGLITLTAGDIIWIGVENSTSTGNITHKTFNLHIHRL